MSAPELKIIIAGAAQALAAGGISGAAVAEYGMLYNSGAGHHAAYQRIAVPVGQDMDEAVTI